MSCITQLLEIKGDKEILSIHEQAVIEGGGCYKGFEYLITFTSHGTRCGYVAIPDSYRGDYSDVSCHGGLTFTGSEHGAKDLLPISCNDIWIGFDCAHYGDKHDYDTAKKYFNEKAEFIDAIVEFYKGMESIDATFPSLSHKTYEYVEIQCKDIIDQLINNNI